MTHLPEHDHAGRDWIILGETQKQTKHKRSKVCCGPLIMCSTNACGKRPSEDVRDQREGLMQIKHHEFVIDALEYFVHWSTSCIDRTNIDGNSASLITRTETHLFALTESDAEHLFPDVTSSYTRRQLRESL